MATRSQARAATVAKVTEAASKIFAEQGYRAATIPLIAKTAGVSVGTVASVGSKDDLFLRSVEELSTANSLAMIRAASAASTVTERVWAYTGRMVEVSIATPGQIQDYFVAYLRSSDHEQNLARVHEVTDALRGLFPDDGLPPEESPAALAASVIWLSFSALCFSLAASSVPPDTARRLMRSIVEAQCAPFDAAERAAR
ncbi:TetR/AcrR family transcriptional regulator [Propionicicella superfundia]|uniref:TetR/AcrR family transcriptional regulator n=1 Tax=Propionicicella superfundia TaxID=348582 RepID=UPI00041CD663|nr:TetR/AcrR family transcriptional regulator [Propionicicella superfundia]